MELTYQGALKLVLKGRSLLGEVLEQRFGCWKGERQGFPALYENVLITYWDAFLFTYA